MNETSAEVNIFFSVSFNKANRPTKNDSVANLRFESSQVQVSDSSLSQMYGQTLIHFYPSGKEGSLFSQDTVTNNIFSHPIGLCTYLLLTAGGE